MNGERGTKPQRVGVIGGGITGISAAIFLRRDGHDVTLFDPGDPGAGTSSGNAGVISTGGIIPTATPYVLKRIPKMLLDPYGPLTIRWRYLPAIAPWLASLVLNGMPSRVEANARAKAALLDHAYDTYRILTRETGTEAYVKHTGLLTVFETDTGWRRAQWVLDLLRRCGRNFEVLSQDQIRQMEPGLAPIFRHAYLLPENGMIVHPGKLVIELHAAFQRMGGTIVKQNVQRIERVDGMARRLVTERGSEDFDSLVVSAGAWSKQFLRQLGTRVLLDAERGYHIMLPQPDPGLRRPVNVYEDTMFLSPMQHGLRLTTGVELAGTEAPPDYTRARRMIKRAARAVTNLEQREQSAWLGFRPSTPNSVPFIGRAPGHANVYCAFGGGHIGMTLGPISGRIAADLVAGRDPGVDLSPYAVDR
ncbi:MAG: FAD-dependent oxidoreductase [Alphaproteobacteria bacterium]|nr:FAD-dependent oxidoreductase [Alphaproteobacteria bacterium]